MHTSNVREYNYHAAASTRVQLHQLSVTPACRQVAPAFPQVRYALGLLVFRPYSLYFHHAVHRRDIIFRSYWLYLNCGS
jgi:hypothetical protein